MKTFDKKDIFSWSNCEEAKQYIGRQGHFADTMTQLRDSINKNEAYTLCRIFKDVGNCFYTTENSYSIGYDFFLPIDKVKEVEEKKYRPFKHYLEFTLVTKKKVGDVINIMRKDKSYSEILVITGKRTDNNNNTVLRLSRYFSLRELFEDYLWEDEKGYWQPFGVEE